MFNKNQTKYIHWFGDWMQDILDKKLHTAFIPSSYNIDFYVGETVGLCVHPKENIEMLMGMGEIISIKKCRIKDVETSDLSRYRGYNTVPGLVEELRQLNPMYEPVINKNTEVLVITISRNSYSLDSLNSYFKKQVRNNA